jgi:outer membrane protein OmpA-like peptidoglycan-associated protein
MGDTTAERLIEIAKIGDVIGCYVDGVNAGYLDLPYNPVYGTTVGILVTKGIGIDIDYFEVRERPTRDIRVVVGGNDQVRKSNLGKNINSEWSDLAPVISADARTLYFARSNHPENIKPTGNNDIWYSMLDADDEWTLAQPLGPPLNNDSANFVISVSPDGNSLLVAHTYHSDGSPAGGGLSISRRTAKGWSVPKAQKLENYYNLASFGEFSLSPDGKVLVMAIEREDTRGAKDLYVSFRTPKGNWSEPLNMGGDVNTIGTELGPFIASDGQTMYFSSNGLPGYGNQDIFIARRLDSTWTHWSEPENLGPFVNGRAFDAYYTVSARGDYAYLVSSDGTSYGAEDIYRIKLPQAARPKPVILVSGKVLNAKTKAPVEAEVLYEYLPSGLEAGLARSNPSDGSYKISLPAGSDFGFRAEASGYYAVSEQLSTKELKEYTEITKNLLLAPIEEGEAIRLNNIFFDFAKAELRPESFPELQRLAAFLKINTTVSIELGGHTDNIGNDEANQKLSEERVEAVKSYLIDAGINKARLKAVGYGKKRPLVSNDTDEGRQQNRRVEFIILKR